MVAPLLDLSSVWLAVLAVAGVVLLALDVYLRKTGRIKAIDRPLTGVAWRLGLFAVIALVLVLVAVIG